MSRDAEKRAEEMIHKLRKIKGLCPMTPEEADAAYDAAPAEPISDDEIRSIVEFVTSGGKASWEPKPDLGWADRLDVSDVEDEALQLYRNKSGGEDDDETADEQQLRDELLSDDETEDEDGIDGGAEPPAEGR